jgi:hypothetical protein
MPVTDTTTRLHRLVIEGVAGVDKPANYTQTGGKAGWLVMKAATLDKNDDTDKAKGTKCAEDGCEALVKDGETECAEGHKQPKEAAKKADTPADPALAAALAAIEKAAADRVAAAQTDVAKAQDTATKALKAAEAERDIRLNAEWVVKADEYVGLGADAATLGPVLRACSEALTAEHFDTLAKALRAGVAATRFTTRPAGATVTVKTGSAYEQLDALAKAHAATAGISKAAAFDVVTNDPANAHLLAAYIQER